MSRDTPAVFASVRVWLFDFDNTIAALEPKVDWAASRIELEAFLRREGVSNQIFSAFPKGNLPLYDALHGRLLGPSRSPETVGPGPGRSNPLELLRQASTIIEAYELRGAAQAEPLPGAIELLRELSARDLQVLIVTSNSSRTVGRWLERFGLTSSISAVIGRDAMLPLKPAPNMIELALDRARCSAHDACFVGDSEADGIAAAGSAVRLFGIASDPSKRARLLACGALEVFDSPAEMMARRILLS